MSGNAHQRKVTETAVSSVLKKMGNTLPVNPQDRLGRSSIEAYIFFILAEAYAVMSAFGISVNFWAGLVMSLFMAGSAIHLLWSSIWTHNWNKFSKFTGTSLVAVIWILVVNQGYVHTHSVKNPNIETLSAVQNVANLIKDLKGTTVIVDPDGHYPQIELDDPKDKTPPKGNVLLNIEATNVGNATARSQFSSVGLFVAPFTRRSEDLIFKFLYSREHDPTSSIPYGNIGPKKSATIPVTGPLMREDGTLADDADRMAILTKKKAFYVAVLVTYQDSHGHLYHRELCYYSFDPGKTTTVCNAHNGQA